MKVVHLTSAHSRNSSRIFHKMAMSSVSFGHDVCIIVADGKGDSSQKLVKFFDVGFYNNKYLRFFISSLKVVKKANNLNADIYHLHDPDLLLWALLLKSKGRKVIFDAHEDYPLQIMHKHYIPNFLRKPLSMVFSFFQRFICKKLDGIVTATPHIKKKFEGYTDTVLDIKNYPLLSEFSKTSNIHRSTDKDSFSISYVGGITTIRGIKEVVKGLELLDDRFVLKLAGKFMETNLEKELKLMSGWSKVDYKGLISRQGVAHLLSNSSCGIVTLHPTANYIDALPIKMFEYMAVGLPVIGSDFPLLRSIVEELDCGILVDPLDPKAISEAISYLHEHPREASKMGENGKMAFQSVLNFEYESIALDKFYQS